MILANVQQIFCPLRARRCA